jgi:antitoxin PrlF
MSEAQELCATVSSKGQVVIPSDVGKHLGLAQGSVLRFVLDADAVRLLPATGDVRRLKGRLAAPDKPVTVDDMNLAIAERRASLGAGAKR